MLRYKQAMTRYANWFQNKGLPVLICSNQQEDDENMPGVINKSAKKGYAVSATLQDDIETFFSALGLSATDTDENYIFLEAEIESDVLEEMKFPYIRLLKILAPFIDESHLSVETYNGTVRFFVEDGELVFKSI